MIWKMPGTKEGRVARRTRPPPKKKQNIPLNERDTLAKVV